MPQPAAMTGQPMNVRSLARAGTVDVAARTFEFVAATENPVRTWIPDPSGKLDANGFRTLIEVDEVLLMSGLDLSRAVGMPFVDSHNTSTVDATLGSVLTLTVEEVNGLRSLAGVGKLVPSRAAMAEAMAEGHYAQLSIGFHVRRHELELRPGDVPLAYAVDWELQEVSSTAVGADRFAQRRSAQNLFPYSVVTVRSLADPSPKDPAVDFEALTAAAEAALTAADEAVAALPAEAPAGTDAALSQRAAAVRLRSLRAEAPADKGGKGKETEGKADADEKNEGKGETAEDKAERSAVAAVRSIAASYGADLVKTVDDLVALGTRSADIRTSVRSAVMARAAATPSVEVKPDTSGRSAGASTISVRDVFSNMNSAFKR